MEGIGGVIRRRADDAKKKPRGKTSHLPGIEVPEERKERYMHSDAHVLAAEISAHFSERKKFALYLAVIRRIGVPQARTLFASIKSGDVDAQNPRKFFMWLSKSEPKKPAKPAPRKRPGKQLDFKSFLR